MSSTRLLILGVVRALQPVHGYEVRRELVSWHAETWANVAYGSIYHALSKMCAEGLLEEAATERQGNRPTRTSYRITASGEAEFQRLLRAAWWTTQPTVDPFYAAISFLHCLNRTEAAAALRHRAAELDEELRRHVTSRRSPQAADIPRHMLERWALVEERLRVEIGWCANLAERIEAGELYFAGEEQPTPPHR
jgi:DNA-binding PadR family transcriptional regulator